MTYPSDFSRAARARIVKTKIKAQQDFRQAQSDVPSFPLGAVTRYVMTLFSAFAKEACALARSGVWGVDQVEREVLDWIHSVIIFAEAEEGVEGFRFRRLLNDSGMSVRSEMLALFKREPEWKPYEDELIEISGLQSDTGTSHSQTEKANKKSPSQFPRRAAWTRDRLHDRDWDHNRPPEFGGPDRKTMKRLLNGLAVHEGTIDKLITALNKHPRARRVASSEVPND